MNSLAEIDRITADFKSQFGYLNESQLHWKGFQDEWSISQNMSHLIQVNSSYFPIFDAIQSGSYKPPIMARFGPVVRLFETLVLRAVQPDRKNKMKTFPKWEPDPKFPGNSVELFEKHQEKLKEYIRAIDPNTVSKIVIASPAKRTVVYSLEAALNIIVTHEQRHLMQSLEILNRLKSADGIHKNTH